MQTMQQLGRYEILAELGRGAMGAVFRARDPRIDRTVAIKTIAVPSASAESMEEYRQRFFREAQAAGRLSHPGIVTIFDVGEDQPTQTPFIVMEYVDGRTLDHLVADAPEGRLPLDTALDLIQQIAEALNYAHSAGIVHRDIKPANIIVTGEGRAKIADFGIAKFSQAEITTAGHVLGTPAYMSPEQINGGPIDGRSDLFSLGVIAYWMLSGVKPFDGDTVTAICVQVAAKDPEPASRLNRGLGPGCDYVLSRALAKDPDRRYQHGKDFAVDIQDLRAGRKPRSMAVTVDLSSSRAAAKSDQTVLLDSPAVGQAPSQNPGAASPALPVPGPGKRRGRFAVLYVAVAVVVILSGLFALGFAGGPPSVWGLGFGRNRPATLQIVGQYPFRRADIHIWVDDDLRYHDEVRGAERSHYSHTSPAGGGSIALTIPVRSGRHIVRVQVDAPGRAYDHDTAVPGYFRAYTQKTLHIDFSSRNLALRWE
ncbi:MAG TPA: serine/threonine-protein kinase [Candidatus Limnocylindrales bacterium]|nr:serine/threonine-protein kinase [Candidatus Limnocylindrales bacterium]